VRMNSKKDQDICGDGARWTKRDEEKKCRFSRELSLTAKRLHSRLVMRRQWFGKLSCANTFAGP
jgi:hypothetical protein